MAFYIGKANVAYVSVPKCACTSLKQFAWQVEHGRPAVGRPLAIHRKVPGKSFVDSLRDIPAGALKVTVIRHPADRLMSAYEDKILSHDKATGRLDAAVLTERGLSRRPSFGEFIERLVDYQALSKPIRHHSAPLSYFIGRDPKYFDLIADISEIGTVVEFINSRAGTDVAPPHLNPPRTRSAADAVTEAALAKIDDLFAEDFALYGDWIKVKKIKAMAA